VTITLPSGWRVSGLPPEQNQYAKAVVYTMKAEGGQGTIHLSRNLVLDLLLVDAKYYGSLRDFFQVVRTGDDEQIILQPGNATAGK